MSEDQGVQLHAETIEAIRQLLNSDAWERFFKPSLEQMKQEWQKRLMDPSENRKAQWPDDFVRGCFSTIDVFLRLPDALIEEHDAAIEKAEQERNELRGYEDRVASGQVGPYSDTGTSPER